ncbi:MAG: disulfide bond formation protein B [gamma proteobacterium symbiont of Bathyaustriella thionipta]|nr:disulfide bond formation protein B [gamma proteobacterium symbiont of Bathyaustriella thionipta]MCU7949632.1 disulfide bond formation protein B [gamma proteobacterium symbiont of Bathyaustriella thionipta]MCU7952198.1 disulfide bond formation protein B [gamma proteobacterium symbiont of Bathyaustriella thionipta]MCU7956211.1 disulfide bond formation protein B [gamma proteobacterium symbiont of Bathyaustriella thionipta]MCU7966803.1 disulfide bond formation protein B [gamma proteobacterium sy
MIKKRSLSSNKYYWLSLILLGLTFESIALYYQYVLGYLPCVLCIHIRVWVLALITLSILALYFIRLKRGALLMQFLLTIISAGLLERTYQLIGVEQGFITGSCAMDSGLPGYFALDKWFPLVFEVQEPCGYTPEVLFGITMAEALIVFSIIFLLFNLLLFILLVKKTLHPE